MLDRRIFESADARQAVNARRSFVEYLRRSCSPDSDFLAAEIIFGELIANVVRHAPGPICATVTCASDCILEVRDEGVGFDFLPREVSDILSESGRGLFLVANLSRSMSFTKDRVRGSLARVVLPVVLIG